MSFDPDEISQIPSPLSVPSITLQWYGLSGDLDGLYRDVHKWVSERYPRVLWSQGNKLTAPKLFFETTELFVEFCQTFPIFLRGGNPDE